MIENGTPSGRAETRMQKADAAIDAKALGALAAAADSKPDGPWEVKGRTSVGLYLVVHKTTSEIGFMDDRASECYRICGELNEKAAADMGLHEPANRDAALGLPLGPTTIDGEDVLDDPFDFDFVGATPPIKPHDGTKPGPTTPCRTDAASLSTRRDRAHAGVLMRNVMTARARMFGLLATEEEKAAFIAWEEATNLWIDHIIEGGAA
jgi:hypothetical protein